MFSLKASFKMKKTAWSALNHKSEGLLSRYVFNLYVYEPTVQTKQQEV